MYSTSWLLTPLFALTAIAGPINHKHNHNLMQRADGSTFNIEIENKCDHSKDFALYETTGSFQMKQRCDPVTIDSGDSANITAPYDGIGMKLSGNADWDTAGQWAAQALFEFGYSESSGMEGTAYDLSVMEGSDKDIGLAVYPSHSDCPSKKCSPDDCPADQGWTHENQMTSGSPADTVCYHGQTDFKVVFCP